MGTKSYDHKVGKDGWRPGITVRYGEIEDSWLLRRGFIHYLAVSSGVATSSAMHLRHYLAEQDALERICGTG